MRFQRDPNGSLTHRSFPHIPPFFPSCFSLAFYGCYSDFFLAKGKPFLPFCMSIAFHTERPPPVGPPQGKLRIFHLWRKLPPRKEDCLLPPCLCFPLIPCLDPGVFLSPLINCFFSQVFLLPAFLAQKRVIPELREGVAFFYFFNELDLRT